jgi:hypothetical protein
MCLFVRLISHQPAVLFSQNEPATSNQPAVLFSQNKSAPAISHQPNEQALITQPHSRRHFPSFLHSVPFRMLSKLDQKTNGKDLLFFLLAKRYIL